MESLLFASQALADAGEAAPMLGQLITQVDPTTTAVWMPGFLEFVAVIAGAVSGALTACDKRLDIGSASCLPLFLLAGSAPGKQAQRDQRRHCRRPGACRPHWRAHHKQNPNTTPSAVEA